MRIRIDEQVLNGLKEKIINYFKFDKMIINRVDQYCKALYIENLKEKNQALMISRANEIAIDKSFLIFDDKENIIKFDDKILKLIRSQLGHELLHMFSRDINEGIDYSGINCYDERKKSYIIDYTGLNEGITQMFVEDIFGYVVSPFSDGYKDYKKIAKIMRLCLGNKPFFNSYFYHNNMLRDECNRLSGNNFFEKIAKTLTDLYYLKETVSKRNNSYNQIAFNIYNKRINSCFANVIINLVLPKLNSLKIEEKKFFIKAILKVVSDDKEREIEVEGLLTKYINLSSEELSVEKRNIDLFEEKQKQIIKLINFDSKKTSFYLNQNGDIYYMSNQSYIPIKKDIDLCEYIYSSLYSNYFNFNVDKIINQLKMKKSNPKIIFPSSYGIKKRRIMFSKIKNQALEKHGIIILNNYLECDKEEIKINYVKSNLDFIDLKKLSNRYQLERESFFENCSVIDRITKQKVYNKTIIDGVRFAYLWDKSQSGDKSITFDENNKKLFDELMFCMTKNLEMTGNLNYKDIYNYALKNNLNMIKVLKNLFRNPITYEWVYNFVSTKVKKKKLNVEKEKSMAEINPQYNENIFNLKVDEILKK